MLAFALLLLSGSLLAAELSAQPLRMVVPTDVAEDVIRMAGETPLSAARSYEHALARRDVVEVFLVLRALHLGGWQGDVVFLRELSYARHLQALADGKADLHGMAAWLHELSPFAERLHISAPVMANGEFSVGIYTAPDNEAMLAVRDLATLGLRTAVSNRLWQADWLALERLGVRRLEDTRQWSSMVRMVARHRVDFLLAPFTGQPDLSLYAAGQRLVPVRGLRVTLPGSRHFVVGKQRPDAELLAMALDRGLATLRDSGELERAYRESGVRAAATLSWPDLLAPASKP